MEPTTHIYLDCRRLFVESRGRKLTNIEREMRALGHTKFHRRILYSRGSSPGWIQKYNWPALLSEPSLVRDGSPQACAHDSHIPPSPSPSTDSALLSDPPTATDGPPHMSVPPAVAGGSPQPIDTQTTTPSTSEIPNSAIHNPHFPQWLTTVSSNMTWTWRHQQVILDQLEKVTSGECKRLMIFLPPRHGKSELVTVRYTAWRMHQNPATNVILGSYNQRLAGRLLQEMHDGGEPWTVTSPPYLNAERGMRSAE
jgi:hypothetical protein